MARTRGASTFGVSHDDDGELLGKDGEPIPTVRVEPAPVPVHVGAVHQGHPIAAAPAPVSLSAAFRYETDRTTWQRNMEASEALRLLEVILGDALSASLAPADWLALPPDVRRHFRRVTTPD